MPGKIPAKASPYASAAVGIASMVVGAENTNVINVAATLKDANNHALGQRVSVFAYISTDSHGDNVTASAPSGGVVIGTNGVAIPLVAGKAFQLISKSDGTVDLNFTEAGTPTFYLVIVLPDGSLAVSGPITFA